MIREILQVMEDTRVRDIRWMIAVGFALVSMFLLAVNTPSDWLWRSLGGATFLATLLLELGSLVILWILVKSHLGS